MIKMDAKFIDKKTSITLKGSTKDILADIGSKGDSYEDIVMYLFHQRNILLISNYCGSKMFDQEDFSGWVYNCFKDCNIPYPHYYIDDENGEMKPFTDVQILDFEAMATDKNIIGEDKISTLTMSEAITNAYCLMYDIFPPTWGIGAMKKLFAR